MAPIYTTGVTGVQTASVCSFAPGAGLVTFRQTFVYLAKGCGCACASLPREAAANVMGTNRELVVAASLAARAAASNRSMKISAIIAVPATRGEQFGDLCGTFVPSSGDSFAFVPILPDAGFPPTRVK